MNQALLQELCRNSIAQAVYIHGIARYEVCYLLAQDSRTFGIYATSCRFTVRPYNFMAAARAVRRHNKHIFLSRSLFHYGAYNFGNDFSRFLNNNRITDANVLFFYIIFIM